MKIKPLSLAGQIVKLEPLSRENIPDLTAAGRDPAIWQFLRYGVMDSQQKMAAFVDYLLSLQNAGTDLPFTVFLARTGKAIGMTRYLNIDPANRAVEIGGTWYAPEYQRTGVNTECKYLLLAHAFEDLGCIRVQFKTDLRNERSQRAIERLGAIREGVLRNHLILPDGTIRSSVYFSILVAEWPGVKAHLQSMMNADISIKRGDA